MKYKDLRDLFRKHERNGAGTHLTAYITFTSASFASGANYSERERTYVISSDNKAFQPNKGGYSIFGGCLDGKSDPCIRLDRYMAEEHGGKDGWIVETCCLVAYLLTSANERELRQLQLFYARPAAIEAMLRDLCEQAGLRYEEVAAVYVRHDGEVVDAEYGTTSQSAWLNARSTGNWDWSIQKARIYDPCNIVFGNDGPSIQTTVKLDGRGF